jgi:hypothetical protein
MYYKIYILYITIKYTKKIILGVCKGEAGSTSCCEVPMSITGTFLADTQVRIKPNSVYYNEY